MGRFFGWFNRNFDAFARLAIATALALVPAAYLARRMLVYAGIVARAGVPVRAPAHRLSAGRGPGLRHHPDHPARRRHPGPHPGGGASRSSIITSTTRRTMSTSSSPWPASASPASGQNTGIAFVHLKRLERAHGRAEQRRRHRQRAMHALLHASATRRSSPWCRRRCRNWAIPPASTSSWKTAAISAMPA